MQRRIIEFSVVFFILGIVLIADGAFARNDDTIRIVKAMVLPIPAGYSETIVAPNPVEARLALGTWAPPKEGDEVIFPGNLRTSWRSVVVDSTGWFTDSAFRRCYAYCTVQAPEKRSMLLEAMGNEMVYVNGAPRSGNPYGLQEKYESWEPRFDYSRLPLQLEKGANWFLFRCSRERLKAKLVDPGRSVLLNPRDVTLPDLVAGEQVHMPGAIVVINATDECLGDLLLSASYPGGRTSIRRVGLHPFSIEKCTFRLDGDPPYYSAPLPLSIALLRRRDADTVVLDSVQIPLRVVTAGMNRKETFYSYIDGSVQYYSVNSADVKKSGNQKPLVLSLHGASVEAINQTASYRQKPWCHIVSPTNRRPYGFNWEEWGRMDVLEVLGIVKNRYPVDGSRVYLTGHSMGGHGTWHIGSLYPDTFAAIAPSAGWISFWTYRFRGMNIADTTPVRAMIRRATAPSETFVHAPNYRQLGVYVLHGSDDDNVRVDQARMMVDTLKKFHKDFVYHEQPGAGHWWDNSDEDGADCVDWPAMFDFFARHRMPRNDEIREISFVTTNPGVSARCHWVTIDAQIEQLKPSSIDIRYDPGKRRYTGTTNNIARLALDDRAGAWDGFQTVILDSQIFDVDRIIGWSISGGPRVLDGKIWFERSGGKWKSIRELSEGRKRAERYGTFKEALRNNVRLIYGTKGSIEENRWAFEKARYDADKFWYQGNGSIKVNADTAIEREKGWVDGNVILYGNSKTNAVWERYFSSSPVQVSDNEVAIGGRKIKGKNICCIFVRPWGQDATIGAVSGTGIAGMRIANRMPYMSPGINLPDCTVFNTDVLTKGDEGVIMTGFFGLDWSVEKGEFVWTR